MKKFKTILLTLVIGVSIGLALGVNIGREQPLLSNPFAQQTFAERMKTIGNDTLDKSSKAVENTVNALQGK